MLHSSYWNCQQEIHKIAFWVVCFFLCWRHRQKASAILGFNVSYTMSACRSSQLPQQVQTAHLQRRYTQPPLQACEDWHDGWDMICYHQDNKSPPPDQSLDHQRGTGRAPPGWSHQRLGSWLHISFLPVLWLHISFLYRQSENGEVKERTLLTSIQHGHTRQIPLAAGPWILIPHSKWSLLILRVSYLRWTFPCWAVISISCCHRA